MNQLTLFLATNEGKLFASQKWRLNNLYRIVDRNGDSIKFTLNAVQTAVYQQLHSRNLILKARQLGMSTFAVIYLLDEALFNVNLSAGIVSYSLEHAQHIFKRIIGHALDNIPKPLQPILGITQRSAREITFANGSFLRVDTTLRGGAYQIVLVSEFGKTCARNPLKAEEVVTGTLQTVAPQGRIIIESTGEGTDGFFAEMVTNSSLRGNDNLSPLEYRLHFFPWYTEPAYQSDYPITGSAATNDYFTSIEHEQNITITQPQRNWYLHQLAILQDKMRQEFPSTIKEAFLSSSDAYYFAQCLEAAYTSSRMLSINPYDALSPVYCAMDIGVNDLTVIVFFQVVHGEIRVIDYYEGNNKGLDHYAHHLLQSKNYVYHTIFLPHDAAHRDGIIVENTYEREFKKLFAHTQTKFMVLKRTDKNIQISNAKMKFERCVFNLTRVKPLVDQLAKYRKKWSEQFGKYLDEPYHDTSSNYADAFQYACAAVTHIETMGDTKGALDKHKALTEKRRLQI